MKLNLLSAMLLLAGTCATGGKFQTEPEAVIYTEESRGYFYRLTARSDSLLISSRGADPVSKSAEMPPGVWQVLAREALAVPPAGLSELPVTSDRSAVDAAAITHLSIRMQDTVYHSPYFDAGNPPEPLKRIVDELMRLAETVE